MKIGIVGLGLIGGSLAKAYKKAGATVFGFDKDRLITAFAKLAEAIDDELSEDRFDIGGNSTGTGSSVAF